MKFKHSKISDTRVKKFFAFFPVRIDLETRWLEFVKIKQEKYIFSKSGVQWVNIKFIDDTKICKGKDGNIKVNAEGSEFSLKNGWLYGFSKKEDIMEIKRICDQCVCDQEVYTQNKFDALIKAGDEMYDEVRFLLMKPDNEILSYSHMKHLRSILKNWDKETELEECICEFEKPKYKNLTNLYIPKGKTDTGMLDTRYPIGIEKCVCEYENPKDIKFVGNTIGWIDENGKMIVGDTNKIDVVKWGMYGVEPEPIEKDDSDDCPWCDTERCLCDEGKHRENLFMKDTKSEYIVIKPFNGDYKMRKVDFIEITNEAYFNDDKVVLIGSLSDAERLPLNQWAIKSGQGRWETDITKRRELIINCEEYYDAKDWGYCDEESVCDFDKCDEWVGSWGSVQLGPDYTEECYDKFENQESPERSNHTKTNNKKNQVGSSTKKRTNKIKWAWPRQSGWRGGE